MKSKIKYIIAIAILLAVIIAVFLYTRPITIEQLFPGIDLPQCEMIRGYYRDYYDRDSDADYELQEFEFDGQTAAFTRLMDQLDGRKFRRTLRSLLPSGTKYHPLQEGDFQWELILCFDKLEFPDGTIRSGSLVHILNYYGKLDISFDENDWRCTTEEQKQWVSDVMEMIKESAYEET